MNLVPTIEEIAASISRPIEMSCDEFAIELSKRVAAIHVKEALTIASKQATVRYEKRTKSYVKDSKRHVVNGGDVFTVNKNSIVDCYPSEMIK